MIDIKLLRENIELVKKNLHKRNYQFDESNFLKLESNRKEIQVQLESSRKNKKELSNEFARATKEGGSLDALKQKISSIDALIEEHGLTLNKIKIELDAFLLDLPNLIDDDVPIGKSENDNQEMRKVGEPEPIAQAMDHIDIGNKFNLIDSDAAASLSGSRFSLLKGGVARLHRALTQFMLDTHVEHHGYTEVYTPYMVKSEILTGTGQLPKFEEDLFQLKEKDLYLIPTAEVPLTNLLRDKITDLKDLPVKFVAHTPCFRSEAGSYGKDTRGLIRLHQFEKVELVQIVHPKGSDEALEELTGHAEKILQLLKLPYRVMKLCSGDIGFSAAKTYDLEVWLPSQDTYREISSCSNCRDFQARRMGARFKDESSNTQPLHTLNGSGLAVGRAMIAVLENYQQPDGSVRIPEVLVPYMGGIDQIN